MPHNEEEAAADTHAILANILICGSNAQKNKQERGEITEQYSGVMTSALCIRNTEWGFLRGSYVGAY